MIPKMLHFFAFFSPILFLFWSYSGEIANPVVLQQYFIESRIYPEILEPEAKFLRAPILSEVGIQAT